MTKAITYELVVEPEDSARAFTAREKHALRPIAETLAMLDGNAFFGLSQDENGDDNHYEQYLPEAWALVRSNGGLDGWPNLSTLGRRCAGYLLDQFEDLHMEDARTSAYGPEAVVRAENGFEIRCPAAASKVDYMRVTAPGGGEIAYWSIDEFKDDPAIVLGAMMGAVIRQEDGA